MKVCSNESGTSSTFVGDMLVVGRDVARWACFALIKGCWLIYEASDGLKTSYCHISKCQTTPKLKL